METSQQRPREQTPGSTSRFIHGPGTDEPFAREDALGGLTYYHADGLGSIVKRTDQTGTVMDEYGYDGWGNMETGSTVGGYAFTSREWDPDTGLYYYRARYYDAKIGRFTSEDPLGLKGGINLFTYVRGNPVLFSDPSGLQAARPPTGPPPSGVYVCQRPMDGGPPFSAVPHGLLWSTMCNQSYSFGPGPPPTGGHVDPYDDPGINHQGKPRPPYQCALLTENVCFQSCVCTLIQEDARNPPKYGRSYMCWDAVTAVQILCRLQCRMRQ